MNQSTVSIIVPCYNGAEYINRCFDSIIAQTYNQIEVVCVNDGSTDKSKEILLSYTKRFESAGMKLVVISQKNQGPAAAINTGLKHISGEFLFLLDVDDLLLPDAIESCVSAFNKDIVVVRGDGFYVNEDDISTPIRKFTEDKITGVHTNLFDELVYGTTYNWAGTYMVRTSKLFDFYPDRTIYPSRYGQNLQILMPMASKGENSFINKPLMKYVQRNNSLSHTPKVIDNILGYMDIRLTVLDAIFKDDPIKEEYKKSVRAASNRLLLELYCTNGNMSDAKNALRVLKADGTITKNDRKLYYKYKFKRILSGR